MPDGGAHPDAGRRPAAVPGLRAATGVLLAGLAIVLLVLAGVDLAATAVAENRAAAAVSEALGMDVEVDIGPWPASPRLLARGELQVNLRASSSEGDGEGAGPGEGGSVLDALDVQLTGATPSADWASFTAERADWSVSLDPARAPLGLAGLAGTARDVGIATGDGGDGGDGGITTLSAAEVILDSAEDPDRAGLPGIPGSAGGPLTAGSAQDVALRLDDRGGQAHLTAARADAELHADGGAAALPLDVQDSHVQLQQLDVTVGGPAPTRVRADSAELRARGVPLQAEGTAVEASGARLDEVVARFQMLAIDHTDGAPELVVRSDGATFSTALDENDLAALWDGPGTIVVADGALQLALPLLAIDVDVRPEGRLLLLTPLLPPALEALLGEVPPVVVTPRLPEGLTFTSVAVGEDVLQLRGGGDRIVVPLG